MKTKVQLANLYMLLVNQLNAKIKLLEIWKALNVENYPLEITTKVTNQDTMNTTAMTSNQPIEIGLRP